MKHIINDTITVTHTMGGMVAYAAKGIYNNTLRIKSERHNKTWHIQLKKNTQTGSLKINRIIVYHYILDEQGFRLQEVENDEAVSEWEPVDYMLIIND